MRHLKVNNNDDCINDDCTNDDCINDNCTNDFSKAIRKYL